MLYALIGSINIVHDIVVYSVHDTVDIVQSSHWDLRWGWGGGGGREGGRVYIHYQKS